MKRRPPQTMDALRGIEGRVAQASFTAWRSIPLRWKGLGRKPIPYEWHHIGPRVAPNTKSNQDATHPVNAFLEGGFAPHHAEPAAPQGQSRYRRHPAETVLLHRSYLPP
jgi:hypothetical protein